MGIGLILILASVAPAAPVALRAAGGAQVDSDPHGLVEVVAATDDWQLGLYTDTLDARLTPGWDRGRGWLGLRAEGGAAGLMISPWRDGAPAPTEALLAHYGGVEAGLQRYLPRGLYVGIEGWGRVMAFGALADTSRPVPGPRLVTRAVAVVGWWSEPAQLRLEGGTIVAPDAPTQILQPLAAAELRTRPSWVVAPRVELRAGLADGQDEVTLTRLGGLNPYVVPLAGAAWAEWWVEDFAAARVGPSVRIEKGAVSADLAAVADLAAFEAPASDTDRAAGLGLLADVRRERWVGSVHLGHAPWIPRQSGVWRSSVYLLVGVDLTKR